MIHNTVKLGKSFRRKGKESYWIQAILPAQKTSNSGCFSIFVSTDINVENGRNHIQTGRR